MASYHLQIIATDGLRFDGQAERLIVRTTTGDVCILPRHINYVTALGMGVARITTDGRVRFAACIGGMLSVMNGEVKLLASTFEWAEDIDVRRAQQAEREAQTVLSDAAHSQEDAELAEARLCRARIRLSAADKVAN